MTEPVDLEELEGSCYEAFENCWCETSPEAKAGFKRDVARLHAAIAELRSLRAFQARLGPVETWFPILASEDSKPKNLVSELSYGIGKELAEEARALIARAKETP
jgi:predicted trehalose synthase